jgi:hypothetical protein
LLPQESLCLVEGLQKVGRLGAGAGDAVLDDEQGNRVDSKCHDLLFLGLDSGGGLFRAKQAFNPGEFQFEPPLPA